MNGGLWMNNTKILYEMNDVMFGQAASREIDYLYVCLNYLEERAWNALNQLIQNRVLIHCLVVLDYYSQEERIKTYLESKSNKCIEKTIFVSAEKSAHETNFTNIKQLVRESQTNKKIALDISCMPVPQFFLLLKWFAKNKSYILIYYTEPQNYIMSEGLYNSFSSMKGPVSVREIRGFSGHSVKKNKVERVLLCLLGFDKDLLPTVIQEASPEKIVTINGFPSFYPKFKDISLVNNEKILAGNAYANRIEKSKQLTNFIYVEADNPFDTYNALHDLKTQYSMNCIDVVPLGTKPMALGLCLFAIENSDIRVIFPFPEAYAEATGEKTKKTIEYILGAIFDE